MNEFIKRLIFGLIYVLLVIYATIYSPEFFLFLFFTFMVLCIYEFSKMIKLKSIYPYILAAVSYYYINYYDELNANHLETKILIIIGVLLIFYPFIKILFTEKKNALEHLGKVFLTYFYIVVPFSILLLIPTIQINATAKFDARIILGVFILIWTNDTFAFLVGRQFGKNKLFERISPKKTIEGFIGGFAFTLIASIVLSKYFITLIEIKHWVIIAIITSIFGTLGDLIESMFKRQASIKDSSNLIPGHGGFLDRLDSIIFATPFIFIYLILFL